MTWTPEQILSLAPDPGAAKNGRGLATPKQWVTLGQQTTPVPVVWGECQGSGKTPYQTQIDLRDPAFRCSCPSRKFPCKHGLGLFLLFVDPDKSPLFGESSPPDWVTEWISSRTQRQEKQAQVASPKDPAAQTKRIAQRRAKMTTGVIDLQHWLQDRIRQGLGSLATESHQFWEQPAARLVDAQAEGLARILRQWSGIPQSTKNWNEILLAEMGCLYLALEGFQRLDTLPETTQADLRIFTGWAFKKEDILTDPSLLRLQDDWWILGQKEEEEEKLRSQRTWLWGISTQKMGLLLQYSFGSKPFEIPLAPGLVIKAEWVFYPSSYPLRGLLVERQGDSSVSGSLTGYSTCESALAAYGSALALQPWLIQFPMVLDGVIPIRQEEQSYLLDSQQNALLLSPQFQGIWKLLAMSGGYPISVFGEWNGRYFLPLSIWANQKFSFLY